MLFDNLIDNARILAQGAFSLTGESEDKQTPLENSLLELWANEAMRDFSTINCLPETESLGSTWATSTDGIPYIAVPSDFLKLENAYLKEGDTWTSLENAPNFKKVDLMRNLTGSPTYYTVSHYNESGVDKRVIFVYGTVTGKTLFIDFYKLHPTMSYKGISQAIIIPEISHPAIVNYMTWKIYSLAAATSTDPTISQKMSVLADKHFALYNKDKNQAQIDINYAGRNRYKMLRDTY